MDFLVWLKISQESCTVMSDTIVGTGSPVTVDVGIFSALMKLFISDDAAAPFRISFSVLNVP